MRLLPSTLLSASILLLPGCQTWPKTDGEVSVGRPQVFSRERLLNERAGEVNWLREQLDQPFEQGFQGFRDVRQAAAFILELGVKFDGAQRRISGIQNASDDKKRERADELAAIQHDLDKLQLQRQLDKLKADTSAVPPTAAVPDTVKNDLAALAASINEVDKKVAALGAKIDGTRGPSTQARDLLTKSSDRLADPSLAGTTRVAVSSHDRLEDESAFRDLVNSRIREKILDDTHDLNGFSLYELRFDATIVPGSNTRRTAIAELTLVSPAFDSEPLARDPFVSRLEHRTEEDVNVLISRMHDRLAHNKLTETWWQRVLGSEALLSPNATALPGACLRDVAANQVELVRYYRSTRTGPLSSGALSLGRCLITDYVRHRMTLALDRWFVISIRMQAFSGSDPSLAGDLPLLHVKVKDRQGLRDAIVKLEGRMKPWVATVEPKEYAQNISDVASAHQVRQLTAAADVSDGRGSSVNARAESFKEEQNLLQAIKRQPLASSFVRGNEKFGWVLGPKYEIRGTKPAFVQATARYTFTASIVVPSWFSSIEMTGCGFWIEGSGDRSAGFPLFDGYSCNDQGGKSAKVTVNLPHNHRGILLALMDANVDLLTEPEIFLLPDADPKSGMLVLPAAPSGCFVASDKSCQQVIVIEGRDLWRNPSVFVGTQKADRVDVLPSMRGVVATFRGLRLPVAVSGGRVLPQDLFISTSAGQDRLRQAVLIVDAVSESPKPFVSLRQSFIERQGAEPTDVTFEYPITSFPRAYSALSGRLRKLGDKEWRSLPGEPTFGAGNLSYRIADFASLGLADRSTDIEVDLAFKFQPGDDWISAMDATARRAVYYAKPEERRLGFATNATLDFSSAQAFGDQQTKQLQQALRFPLPKDEALFFRAYPGLEQALTGNGGSVRIALRIDEDGDPSVLLAERVVSKGRSAVQPKFSSLSSKDFEILPEDERKIPYLLSVAYRRGNGNWIEVALGPPAVLNIVGRKKPPAQAVKPVVAAPAT